MDFSWAYTIIPSISGLSNPVLALLAPVFLITALLTATWIYTTVRYHLGLANYVSTTDGPATPRPPPYVPYSLPFLGSAISFLTPRPGQFWEALFRSHPRSTGCATILLGGKKAHVLFSTTAVQALFKNKALTRDGFNLDIVHKGIGLSLREATAYYGMGEAAGADGLTPMQTQDKINHEFLLRSDRVNELTSEFTKTLAEQFKNVLPGGDGVTQEIGIYYFLKPRMFAASTTAFMGKKILDECPNLCDLFFDFDSVMLTLFFGIPKWINPGAYKIREAVLDPMERFHKIMYDKYVGKPVDPEGDVSWEPDFGSRTNRVRQEYYERRGLNMRSRAGMDLGFLFGLSSNAIPATGWVLMHLLDPNGDKTVLPRILKELETVRSEDGSLDIPTLCSLPLLQSVFHEVLRLYADVLVTRELHEDLVLPLDGRGRKVFLGKNSLVVAPSWLGHRDDASWTSPPSTVFFAERFIKVDTVTGKESFTTGGTNGKLFPFGGGRTICPGRVFAKQEVMASVALILLTFEFEVLGFTDENGTNRATFPSLRKAYNGTGVMSMDGDITVRMKRRVTGIRAH